MRILLATLVLLASSITQAQGLTAKGAGSPFGDLAQPEFLPVEEAYQLEIEQTDDRALRFYWQIEPTYYLYQHRFAFKLEDRDCLLYTSPSPRDA